MAPELLRQPQAFISPMTCISIRKGIATQPAVAAGPAWGGEVMTMMSSQAHRGQWLLNRHKSGAGQRGAPILGIPWGLCWWAVLAWPMGDGQAVGGSPRWSGSLGRRFASKPVPGLTLESLECVSAERVNLQGPAPELLPEPEPVDAAVLPAPEIFESPELPLVDPLEDLPLAAAVATTTVVFCHSRCAAQFGDEHPETLVQAALNRLAARLVVAPWMLLLRSVCWRRMPRKSCSRNSNSFAGSAAGG